MSNAISCMISKLKVGQFGWADDFYLRVNHQNEFFIDDHYLATSTGVLRIECTADGLIATVANSNHRIKRYAYGYPTTNSLPLHKFVANGKVYPKFDRKNLTYLDLAEQVIGKIFYMPRGDLRVEGAKVTGTYPHSPFVIEVFEKSKPGYIEVRRTDFCLQALINKKWYPMNLRPRK